MEIERKWMVTGWPEGLTQTSDYQMDQGYVSVRPTVRIRREALQGGGYNRGALQEYDPADGSTATVWDAPPTGNLWDYQDTYTNVLPARGSRAEDWLWLYGTDGAVGGNRCYLMNAAARELVPITQRMKNYAYDIPPSRLAQTADGRWLLWIESNDENAHLAYGLIAPNDFAAGSTDYTPVEMWAG